MTRGPLLEELHAMLLEAPKLTMAEARAAFSRHEWRKMQMGRVRRYWP
jgi:hypothetical protein